jgi:hypothetical protein
MPSTARMSPKRFSRPEASIKTAIELSSIGLVLTAQNEKNPKEAQLALPFLQ